MTTKSGAMGRPVNQGPKYAIKVRVAQGQQTSSADDRDAVGTRGQGGIMRQELPRAATERHSHDLQEAGQSWSNYINTLPLLRTLKLSQGFHPFFLVSLSLHSFSRWASQAGTGKWYGQWHPETGRCAHTSLHTHQVTFHRCHSWQTKHYNHFIDEWHTMQREVLTGEKNYVSILFLSLAVISSRNIRYHHFSKSAVG